MIITGQCDKCKRIFGGDDLVNEIYEGGEVCRPCKLRCEARDDLDHAAAAHAAIKDLKEKAKHYERSAARLQQEAHILQAKPENQGTVA